MGQNQSQLDALGCCNSGQAHSRMSSSPQLSSRPRSTSPATAATTPPERGIPAQGHHSAVTSQQSQGFRYPYKDSDVGASPPPVHTPEGRIPVSYADPRAGAGPAGGRPGVGRGGVVSEVIDPTYGKVVQFPRSLSLTPTEDTRQALNSIRHQEWGVHTVPPNNPPAHSPEHTAPARAPKPGVNLPQYVPYGVENRPVTKSPILDTSAELIAGTGATPQRYRSQSGQRAKQLQGGDRQRGMMRPIVLD